MTAPKTTDGFLLLGGRLCLDFCNTVMRNHKPPEDILDKNGFRVLIHWCKHTAMLDEAQAAYYYSLDEAQPGTAATIVERARQLRETLYHVFVAMAHQRHIPSNALLKLNAWLHETHTQQQVVFHGRKAVRIWRDTQHPTLMLYNIVLSAEELILSDDTQYVKQCPGCSRLFYDGSKNHRRTWCDMRRCGNRAKNRRFHQRRKEA